MPLDLVAARHGQSRFNHTAHLARNGNESALADESFRKILPPHYRLMPLGIEQAQIAGDWVRNEFPDGFDRYVTSVLVRPKETAAHMRILPPGKKWFLDRRIIERDVGDLHNLTEAQRWERFPEAMRFREGDPLLAMPPNGQTLNEVSCLYIRSFLDDLHRECAGQKVFMVAHGDTMWAMRAEIENWLPEEFKDHYFNDPSLWNLQIIHWSRVNPWTGEVAPRFGWVRTIRPTGPGTIDESWKEIVYRTYSDEDLLAQVAQYPQ